MRLADLAPHAASLATTRRADIQGLRGIAIGSVVLYHAAPRLAPGGFVGVDIFFVISGFLITSILARELEAGAFSVAGFYQRRVTRLFPALFTMLAATFVAGLLLLAPHDLAELARTTLSTVFFVSNFDFFALSGYFDGDAGDKPLLHTWSLAVEEQFYILYPLLLALVWKLARRRVLPVLVVTTVAAIALSAWGARAAPAAAFYLAPFRAFELLIGAALAMAPAPRLSDAWRSRLALGGAAMMLAAMIRFSSGTHWPGLAALVPSLGAALVLFAKAPTASLGGRVFTMPVLTGLGAISYSLYLWHWPLLSFGRHVVEGALTPWQAAPLIAAAVVLATLSWKFVEQPVLEARWPRSKVFVAGAAAMALTSAFALAMMLDGGAPQRFTPRAQALFASVDDYNHRRATCHGDEERRIAYADLCAFGAPGAAPVAAVWGDSAGAELVVGLGDAMARRGQSVLQITYSGCPPALDYPVADRPHCVAHNDAMLAALMRDPRIRTVVLSANFQNTPGQTRGRLYEGYRRSVEALRAAGKIVVIAYPFPDPWILSPTVLGLHAQRHQPLDTVGIPLASYAADNRETLDFLDALTARTGALSFRMTDTLCPQGFCHSYLPSHGVLYFDGNHITVTGARLAVTRFPFDALPPPSSHTAM